MDEKAFADLYEHYSPALYGAIHRMLKDEELCKDVLQNTFVKIWLHRTCYDPCKGSLFTWMLNIVRNEVIDTLRSKRHRQSSVTTSLEEKHSFEGSNPLLHFDHMDLHKQLFILKPMNRAIMELCFFRGFTCQQTAELLGLPCATVKTKMQHSYKILKAALR